MSPSNALLVISRLLLLVIAVSLGITSFWQHYTDPSERRGTVFFGFAFIAMAIAGMTMAGSFSNSHILLRIAGFGAFAGGFSLFYLALYR